MATIDADSAVAITAEFFACEYTKSVRRLVLMRMRSVG
jgi:hypothetical protein